MQQKYAYFYVCVLAVPYYVVAGLYNWQTLGQNTVAGSDRKWQDPTIEAGYIAVTS